MANFGPQKRRGAWWTRERCIDACAQFYKKYKVAPTSAEWWHSMTQFTARSEDGTSNHGSNRPYPSCGSLNNFWKGMRPVWQAVAAAYPKLKILVDAGDTAWSTIEEWWITESVGILPRTEVASIMAESGLGRTEPAIKRRLYELGVSCYNRWGWTVNHLASVIGVSGTVIQKYMDHGKLPFFQGNRCLFIEPADFLVIQEYDWSRTDHPPELEDAIRKSLMQRLCFVLLRFEWRKFSYHKFAPRRDCYTGRIKQPRAINLPPGPKPTHIAIDDWVVIIGEWAKQPGAKGRVGQVKSLLWSSQQRNRSQKSPARPPCWVATVDFRKMKVHGNPKVQRVHYNVPASSLEKTERPAYFGPRDQTVPQRARPTRKARMKQVGDSVLSGRLMVQAPLPEPEKPEVTRARDQLTRYRGQQLLTNKLNVPNPEIVAPASRRGQKDDWHLQIKTEGLETR